MLTAHTIVYNASERVRLPLAGTLQDLISGLRFAELWGAMGWLDVRQRYSRSVMGPFWVTLSLAAFVVGLGITYGALFRMPLATYLPYITVGIVIWTMISSLLNEGCTSFTSAEAMIKQMPAPLSVHVYRLLWRTLIIFLHNLCIVVFVLAIFGPTPGAVALLAIPGLALVLLNGFGAALALGTLCARFRDIAPLMANIVQMLFFTTPILWKAEALGDRTAIALYNPFYHLIELVRSPILGEAPSLDAWLIGLGFTAMNVLVAFLIYARFRWRIPYWL